jgi:hypothetical protein
VTTVWALDSVSTGTSPIVSVSWLSMLNMLVTLTKEGTIHVWRARVNSDPNKPHMRANFLEPAGNLLCAISSVAFEVCTHFLKCFSSQYDYRMCI